MIGKFLPLTVIAALLCGCSIKEERLGCPCRIRLVLDNAFNRVGIDEDCISLAAFIPELYSSQTVRISDYPEYYEMSVPKGNAVLCAAYGVALNSDEYMIPDGHQSDSIYVWRRIIDTNREDAEVSVILSKQFSSVFIHFDELENDPGVPLDFRLEISGGTSGLRLMDIEPVKGTFHCQAEQISMRDYVFRMPRQAELSLLMEVYSSSGKKLAVYPIGEMMEKAGYQKDQESLEDAYLEISLAEVRTEMNIMDWQRDFTDVTL